MAALAAKSRAPWSAATCSRPWKRKRIIVLLLITSEPNITSDLLTLSYGGDVFRWNVNLWRDYRVSLTRDRWEIINAQTNRSIDSERVTRAYWWKAFSNASEDDNYVKEEIRYLIFEIYGWCAEREMVRGNSPLYHRTLGKLAILGKAANYFCTPLTLVSIGLHRVDSLLAKKVVAKSLSSESTDAGRVLMTTEVDPSRLDPAYPWYLQEKIESSWDVTVFYCNGQCFSFKKSRSELKGLDWRAEQFSSDQECPWIPFELQASDEERIRALSNDLKTEFGRYDFLANAETEQLIFLEFNAGGQWMFLDPERKFGLLDCVVSWLRA